MRGVADTSWLEALPAIAVALLVLFLPGVVAALLLRCRPATALGVGPALSVTAISLGGVAAAAVGLGWGTGTFALVVAALWVFAGLAGLVRRLRPTGPDGPLWPMLVGAVLALGAVAAVLLPLSGSADSFPQHPDTVFHLSDTRWMLEQRDISALHAAGYASPSGTGFYPAAFHGVAATVALLSSATVVTSVSATVLVSAGLVWPLGLMLLARRVLGPSIAVTVTAALASVAFTAFPYWLLGYGVLWPNLLGQALLPAMLAVVVAVVWGPDRWSAAVLLGLGVPGLALAHPNALIALALLSLVIGVFALAGLAWQQRHRPLRAGATVGGIVVGLLATAAAWQIVTARAGAMRASNPKGPEMPWRDALLDVLLFAPRDARYLWVPGVLVVCGLVVVAVRHRRGLWVVGGFLLAAGLYLGLTAVDNEATRLATWPWYNNSPRLAALLVVPAALLATAALAAAADGLERLFRRHTPLAASATTAAAAATAAVCAAYLVLSVGGEVRAHRALLDDFFDQKRPSAWVTDAELAALRDLGRQLPADAVVAANPLSGGSYLYLVSGHRLLYPSEKAMTKGDLQLLGRRIDDIGTDPKVCAAARRHDVTHVLTGGKPTTFGPNRKAAYAGLAAVPGSPAFEEIGQSGPYRLYRITACAGAADG